MLYKNLNISSMGEFEQQISLMEGGEERVVTQCLINNASYSVIYKILEILNFDPWMHVEE